MGTLAMTEESGSALTERIYNDLLRRENVTIMTGTEVISSKGSIGNFTLKVRKRPTTEGDPVETAEFNVGSVVVATGFDSYQPKEGEYGFAKSDNVIALPDFRHLIDDAKGKELIYKGRKIPQHCLYLLCREPPNRR